jgi:peptidoglycan-associated lipoprotein
MRYGRTWKGWTLALIAAALLAQGCSETEVQTDESIESAQRDARGLQERTPSDRYSSSRGGEESLRGEDGKTRQGRLSMAEVERTLIYFDFDQFRIREDMRPVVDQVAQYLLENPRVQIQVEGHADERGTPDYNIALGHKRAQTVKSYLVNLGVAPARVATMSFGEERPVTTGRTEKAWEKNRRAKMNIIEMRN